VANVFGLGEGSDFQHPPRRIDAESLFLINHKPLMICGALNPHFCQASVSGSLFFSQYYFVIFKGCYYYLALEIAILIASPVRTLAINHFCACTQDGFLAKKNATFDAVSTIIKLILKLTKT
jgi:hypothetical protein